MDVNAILDRLGGARAGAEKLGLKRTALVMWRTRGQVPAKHVRAVSRATGIPPHELRPDLWDPPDTGPRQEAA